MVDLEELQPRGLKTLPSVGLEKVAGDICKWLIAVGRGLVAKFGVTSAWPREISGYPEAPREGAKTGRGTHVPTGSSITILHQFASFRFVKLLVYVCCFSTIVFYYLLHVGCLLVIMTLIFHVVIGFR
ncbi:hypothetical protein TIFTF001_004246 [Ficus carica]|uniref:Uncharacterized protein n=1 Tax=Ficus carica TaxID=3494 RepID=A0AA87ZH68_FICCA|nr:hypothetical protein TIFTF001_004246 [Ficus carica]